jgi:hypothetical protein
MSSWSGDVSEVVGTAAPPCGELLGAGRSGVVYKETDAAGRIVARKVFDSDTLTKAVQYVFLGAPNPYAWSEHAVRGAVLRRRVLVGLVRLWFGDRLTVATAWGMGWNPDRMAFELYTQFVDGSPPMLHHPMNRRGAQEVGDLLDVMATLQAHLEASGFDGMVWQAGRGNPVALANFLRTGDGALGTGDSRWAWIDLESGVPALFPAQPVELFRFYLRKWLHYGRPLFDDVDGDRLQEYLDDHRDELHELLGEEQHATLRLEASQLHELQEAWRSLPRHRRSITARRAKQAITAEEADYYGHHPLRWYAREVSRLPGKSLKLLADAWRRVLALVRNLPWRRLPTLIARFLSSQRYRYRIARRFTRGRIEAWRKRGQLEDEEANRLFGHLQDEESAAYLTDFGVHLSLKPFVKFVEYAVFPTLFASGAIGPTTLGIALLFGGSIGRTAYTLGRVVQCTLLGHERPWVALGTGILPVVGNLAYPAQIVYSSTVEQDLLAQFLLYDSCTVLGRKLPIWGGRDTLTEHTFNHLPDLLVRRLQRSGS